MARVLVTGAAGFLGSHVAEHCLRLGFEVVGIDDLSGGCRRNIPAGVVFEEGSLNNERWVGRLWRRYRFDYVYHLAAYAAEGLSHFVRRFNYRTNLLASVALCNQAVRAEAKCFVFTSSIAVYGAGQTPMTEDLQPRPEDPYAIAKLAVELDLAAAHRVFGLPYVVLRPHNVYGERQNLGDPYRNVVGIFVRQALRGEPMTVFGDGCQTRAFSHVDDVAPVIARAPLVLAAYQQTFNVGGDRAFSVLELARLVAQAAGVPLAVRHLPPRQEVTHVVAAHDKLRRVFDLPQAVPLEEGVARMIGWARQHGIDTPSRLPAIEVERAMPPSWRELRGSV